MLCASSRDKQTNSTEEPESAPDAQDSGVGVPEEAVKTGTG
jgi:hypothetical protein